MILQGNQEEEGISMGRRMKREEINMFDLLCCYSAMVGDVLLEKYVFLRSCWRTILLDVSGGVWLFKDDNPNDCRIDWGKIMEYYNIRNLYKNDHEFELPRNARSYSFYVIISGGFTIKDGSLPLARALRKCIPSETSLTASCRSLIRYSNERSLIL